MTDKVLNLDCTDLDFYISNFYQENKNVTIRKKSLNRTWVPNSKIDGLTDSLVALGFVVHHTSRYYLAKNDKCYIYFDVIIQGLKDGNIQYTDAVDIKELTEAVVSSCDNTRRLDIRWYIDAKGNYYDLVECVNEKTYDSMYPEIKGGIEAYIQKFLESKESILILIGEPGTGKTNFIRNIISAMDKRVCISYDENVFNSDSTFADFVGSERSGSFIIEDADVLLTKREDGNKIMSKFLNVGDGIIKLSNKKLIFSTNLPSVNDIDEAIMRPGRCFDVLKFRKLTLEEANKVCHDFNLNKLTENKEYRLADIFNQKEQHKVSRIGFY